MDFIQLTLTYTAYIIGGLVLLMWLSSFFVFVPEKTFVTTAWFGTRFMRILKPGVSLKLPYPLESVGVKLSTKVQPLAVNVQSLTKDNAQITIHATIHYMPKEGNYYAAAYSLENPQQQMATYLDNYLRAHISSMNVQEIFSSTTEFQHVIMAQLTEKFANFGYEIDNVLIGEPKLSAELAHAYERKLKAEREQEAAKAEGEALKIKATMKAEAEGNALKVKAEAFKTFRKLIAEGNKEAIELFLEGINDKSVTAKTVLDFFAGLDEREAFRDASAHGGRTVYIAGAHNGSNIAGNVAGTLSALQAIEDARLVAVPQEAPAQK